MSDPIDLIRTDYMPASYHGGAREGSGVIAYLVVHDTEGDTSFEGIESTGRWFQNAAARGSTHTGTDRDSTQRFLEDHIEAAGAPGTNDSGLHHEQAGRASWSRAEWLEHRETIRRTAWVFAAWCIRYNVPVRFVDADELRRQGMDPGHPVGITTHDAVRRAWGLTTHTDPGVNYPMDVLLADIEGFVAQIQGETSEEDDMAELSAEDRALLGKAAAAGDAIKAIEGAFIFALTGNKPAQPDGEVVPGFTIDNPAKRNWYFGGQLGRLVKALAPPSVP